MYAGWPHHSCLTFTFPAPVTKKETKHLKIPAHPYKQPAQREFPFTSDHVAPTEARELHDGDIPQCSAATSTVLAPGAHPGIRWRAHAFRQLLRSLADPPTVRCRPRRLLRARLWSSHFSRSEESHPRWLAAPPPVSPFNHEDADYDCWKCDFLLHLGEKKTRREENLLFTVALHN